MRLLHKGIHRFEAKLRFKIEPNLQRHLFHSKLFVNMPQVVITPWHDHSELIKIRAQFYPPSYSREPDMRRKAVNMVKSRSLR